MKKSTVKDKVKDTGIALTKGVIGMIPILGALASEIFGLVVTPTLEKRRVEWMNEVSEKLKKLEDEGIIQLDKLQENDQFIDTVLQATNFALKTSEKEKIDSLKHALLNTAKGELLDKTKSQIFLNHIDKFTSWHIKILYLIDNPMNWYQKNGKTPPKLVVGSISHMINNAFPELKKEDELINIIWSDLKTAGFHRSGDVTTSMTGNGIFSEKTTQFGKEFIKFITYE